MRGGEVPNLPRCHVSPRPRTAPSIFTAGRTVVLPSKRPELRCNSSGICTGLMTGFLAASNIAATALIWIRRLIHPCEFCANGIDTDESMGMI